MSTAIRGDMLKTFLLRGVMEMRKITKRGFGRKKGNM
jgi:hypothetical protein